MTCSNFAEVNMKLQPQTASQLQPASQQPSSLPAPVPQPQCQPQPHPALQAQALGVLSLPAKSLPLSVVFLVSWPSCRRTFVSPLDILTVKLSRWQNFLLTILSLPKIPANRDPHSSAFPRIVIRQNPTLYHMYDFPLGEGLLAGLCPGDCRGGLGFRGAIAKAPGRGQ